MILQCPSCHARFAVPDALIPADGRTVRCGKCAHQWFTPPAPGAAAPHIAAEETAPPPAASPVEDAPVAAAKPDLALPPSPAQLPAVKPLRIPLMPFKIAAPLLAAAWMVVAFYAYFPSWQDSAVLGGLYSSLGVTNTHGLVFDEVRMERENMGPKTRFLISGSIANQDAAARRLAAVRVELKDAKNNVVWSRKYPVDQVIAAGQIYPFRIDDVETSFADRASSIVLDLGNNFELVMR